MSATDTMDVAVSPPVSDMEKVKLLATEEMTRFADVHNFIFYYISLFVQQRLLFRLVCPFWYTRGDVEGRSSHPDLQVRFRCPDIYITP